MRLTKLEMYGFKSFARKTEIQFEEGITAIIGPNGSGKSNISDAVRWVLGEQSAKALRGAKMEDVIFNGTEQKKPLSYCEVTLSFDNTDGELACDFTEVAVTRRMYRSGESEYMINRASCRRRDIQDLFCDTGVGKDGYSIIGQGKVEEILSNKSQDRRNAFEEAAGVMKYRVRKEDAERKLDSTRTNLERLRDILEELTARLGPLEEQSAAAREYLMLRDELRELEINVFLYQYDKLNEKLSAIDTAIAELTEEIERRTAVDAELLIQCAAEEEAERGLSQVISELNSKLLSMTSGVEARSGESKVFQERLSNMLRERALSESAIEENGKKLDEASKKLVELRRALDEKQSAEDETGARYKEEAKALEDMRREIETSDEALEKRKAELIDAMNRLSDAKILISRFDTIREQLTARITSLEKGKEQVKEKSDKLEREYAEENAIYKELISERDKRRDAKNAAILKLNETNQRLREAREAVSRAEREAESALARLKVLDEMKRAHEGYYQSVKNLMRDADRNPQLKRLMEGVVAELIRVPREYETAIEMAMGPSLQNIVTNNEEDAKRVIEYLREKSYGRATLLPISAMRGRTLDERERETCRVKGFIGIASELVEYDEKYRGVIENLLGRTVIVSDLDAGIAINKRARAAFRIATVKGDIINAGGSMTGGSTQKKEFSIVGRERESVELSKKVASLKLERERRTDEAAELEAGLDRANADVSEASETLHEYETKLATHSEKLDIVKQYADEAKESLDEAEAEIGRIRDDIENIEQQFKNAERDEGALTADNKANQNEIRAMQEALYKRRAEFEKASAEVSDVRVSAAALERERAALEADIARTGRECEELKKSIAESESAVNANREEFMTLTGKVKEVDGAIESERRDIDELTDKLHAVEEERAKRLTSLDEARARRESGADELKELTDKLHRQELTKSRSEVELATMQQRILDDYELTYDKAQPYRRQIALTQSHIRIGEIKTSIKALGDVNVSSIDDYRTVKERHDSLETQYNDLIRAEEDLKTLIAELISTMEAEFRRQFNKIRENFTGVFAELFGGGTAELVLSDENDILNCNIDIIAQPPGKKLQLLSLLSGGERALTAITLLFAILKLKPTAFCILDEIETSLDEVNVATVARYIRDYSDKTQFIMITHRKGSMEVCNALYGVAMEEKGISKVVSARFSESA